MRIDEAFADQATHCAQLGSPFMERLMTLCAERLTGRGRIGKLLWSWPGDVAVHADSVPLRLAGGLHALKLSGDPLLAAVYPPRAPSDEALWSAVEAALETHADFLEDWLKSPPQTNEVRRSGILIPAAAAVSRLTGLPLSLLELGASGGLNLVLDRFALRAGDVRLGPPDPVLTLAPEWRGDPASDVRVRIAGRAGVDLSPIDPRTAEGALRLTAYIWADQEDRMALTRAAISAAPVRPDRGDAADWLEDHLDAQPGVTRFLFHTVAWQYFPREVQSRCRGLIEAAGAKASLQSPLAWVSMENEDSAPGAGLRLRLWPGNRRFNLGRADFHGRWVDWREPEP